MVWKQPQLADPLMGPTDEIRKLQHRLLFAYPTHSKAIDLGVKEHGVFDLPTDQALRNIQAHIAADRDHPYRNSINLQPGVLTYDTKLALGVIVLPPKAPSKRFVQQGVRFDTSAFMMGNVGHSYNEATAEGVAELNRLAHPLVGVPKVITGYSMGDDIVNQWMWQWPADRRDEIKLVVGFGSPSRPAGRTLLGNDPGGSGISGLFTPDWARNITYHFTQEGDMYANSVGLLPWLYDILTDMELSLTFALKLFNILTSAIGGPLLGLAGSVIPGVGALTAGFGALSGILGMVTSGPITQTTGPILQPMGLLTMLPQIIPTLMAALKFVQTNAHYHYHDQPRPFWRGLTAVDCAAQIIAEKVDNAIVYTVPGTIAHWNDGPPAWTAWKLP